MVARILVLMILIASALAMFWFDPASYFQRIRQDHVVHFVVMYTLMLGLVLSYPKFPIWGIALSLLIFSVILEFVQPLFGRECSGSDIIANLIAISLVIIPLWVGKRLNTMPQED